MMPAWIDVQSQPEEQTVISAATAGLTIRNPPHRKKKIEQSVLRIMPPLGCLNFIISPPFCFISMKPTLVHNI